MSLNLNPWLVYVGLALLVFWYFWPDIFEKTLNSVLERRQRRLAAQTKAAPSATLAQTLPAEPTVVELQKQIEALKSQLPK